MARVIPLFFCCFMASVALSQGTGTATLLTDLVKVDSSKMLIDAVGFSHFTGETPPEPVQVRFHSEAPKSLISRDRFVQVSLQELRLVSPKGNFFEPIDHPADYNNFDINVRMNSDGVVIEIVNRDEESIKTITQKWEDIIDRWE